MSHAGLSTEDISPNHGKNAVAEQAPAAVLAVAFQEVSELSAALKVKAADITQRESRVEALLLAAEDQRIELQQRQADIHEQTKQLEETAMEMADQEAYIDALVEERCLEISNQQSTRLRQERSRAKNKLQACIATEEEKTKHIQETADADAHAAAAQLQRSRDDYLKQRNETLFYKQKCQALQGQVLDSKQFVDELRRRLEQVEYERNHMRSKLKVAAWKAQQHNQEQEEQGKQLDKQRRPLISTGNENISANASIHRSSKTQPNLVSHLVVRSGEDQGRLSASCLSSVTQKPNSTMMSAIAVLDVLDDVINCLTPCRTFASISAACRKQSASSNSLLQKRSSLLPSIVRVLNSTDLLSNTNSSKPNRLLSEENALLASRIHRSSTNAMCKGKQYREIGLNRLPEEELGRAGRFIGIAFLVADTACREAVQALTCGAQQTSVLNPDEWVTLLGTTSVSGATARDLWNLVEALSINRIAKGGDRARQLGVDTQIGCNDVTMRSSFESGQSEGETDGERRSPRGIEMRRSKSSRGSGRDSSNNMNARSSSTRSLSPLRRVLSSAPSAAWSSDTEEDVNDKDRNDAEREERADGSSQDAFASSIGSGGKQINHIRSEGGGVGGVAVKGTKPTGSWLGHLNSRVRAMSCVSICRAYPLVRHLRGRSCGKRERHLSAALESLGGTLTSSEGRSVAVQLNVTHALLVLMLLVAHRPWATQCAGATFSCVMLLLQDGPHYRTFMCDLCATPLLADVCFVILTHANEWLAKQEGMQTAPPHTRQSQSPASLSVGVEGAALVSLLLQRISMRHTTWQRVSVWLLQRDVVSLLKLCLQRADGVLNSRKRMRMCDRVGNGSIIDGVGVGVNDDEEEEDLSEGEMNMFVLNAKAVLSAWQKTTRTKVDEMTSSLNVE